MNNIEPFYGQDVYLICPLCTKRRATQWHHKFSQTKNNKKLYPDYIHKPQNLIYICAPCHMSKSVPKLTEHEFCDIMGIEPRSKSAQIRRMREENN